MQRKALANESVDFNRPTEFKNLKDRLSQARAHLDKGNTSYRSREGDSDLRAIQSEVQAIRNARAARDQSLVGLEPPNTVLLLHSTHPQPSYPSLGNEKTSSLVQLRCWLNPNALFSDINLYLKLQDICQVNMHLSIKPQQIDLNFTLKIFLSHRNDK